ncbi:MAG: acylphosphatase [Methanomassiliicoccales archaeon]|jgi:acylphosphatase
MKVCADAIFKGKVQGVHFRDYTRRFARRRGVNGWVKNLPDGTVEAKFEGEKENIEEVIRMLREEHPFARVDKIDLIWSACHDQFDRFDIW